MDWKVDGVLHDASLAQAGCMGIGLSAQTCMARRSRGRTNKGVGGPPLSIQVSKSSELSLSHPGSNSEAACCCCCWALTPLLTVLLTRAFSEIASEALGAGQLFLNPVNDPAAEFIAASDCCNLNSAIHNRMINVDVQTVIYRLLSALERWQCSIGLRTMEFAIFI